MAMRAAKQEQRALKHSGSAAHMHIRQRPAAASLMLALMPLLLSMTQHASAQFLPAVDTGPQLAVSRVSAACCTSAAAAAPPAGTTSSCAPTRNHLKHSSP